MSAIRQLHNSVAPVTNVVDDTVGVGRPQWFVAIVNHNSEKQSSDKLSDMNIENYLPTQTEVRVWKNGRRVKVDRIVIPCVVFVYCTEQKRKEIVGLPFIFRFMTNKAGASSNSISKPLATIPDDQIKRLKFMLGQSDIPVEIVDKPFKAGDKVRVIRGELAGLEGEVSDFGSSQSELVVILDFFGCARLLINTINLELVK